MHKCALPSTSHMFHTAIKSHEKNCASLTWETSPILPFDELILSWNGQRPESGFFLIFISILLEEWSPWMPYAKWAVHDQHTFENSLLFEKIELTQDTLTIKEGYGRGFKIKIVAQEGASIKNLRSLHACCTQIKNHDVDLNLASDLGATELNIQGTSQMTVDHPERERLCSPTSTAAAMAFLSPTSTYVIAEFAKKVRDTSFNIYGNWVLNIAEASHCLGPNWLCYVERLASFSEVIHQLKRGYPVVVSVKGPLSGSALPYASGHLLVIKGFDPKSKKILCMDPAFPKDDKTHVSYHLEDFLQAWKRRKGLTYIFKRTSEMQLTHFSSHDKEILFVLYTEDTSKLRNEL